MLDKSREKRINREKRHRRIRARVSGTKECPRLSVFRSNYYVYAQIIDDENGNTLAHSSSKDLKIKEKGKMAMANAVGKDIAKKAVEKKITNVVFDRGGYIYTGVIKVIADNAREGGLIF
ncbi:MAG: 50S ribosomal protein L18 [Patescibacteria group bacterium]